MAYRITSSTLRFKRFFASDNEVIFVESAYSPLANKCILDNIELIRSLLQQRGMRFVYLPTLFNGIDGSIRYYLPESAKMPAITSSLLLQFLEDERQINNIPPSFIRYDVTDDNGINLYECHTFEVASEDDAVPMLKKICTRFLHHEEAMYCSVEELSREYFINYDADKHFDRETLWLMDDVRDKIRQLRQNGVSEWILQELFQPGQKLSRLIISANFSITLPDYDNMQIAMEPLVKAVYLLFLNHPEGIIFKHLPDYRDELESLYTRVLGTESLTDKMRQSVVDVTDPTKNSINEKCARIRQAFVAQFDDNLAKQYYITGERGCPKRITLPRELITINTAYSLLPL